MKWLLWVFLTVSLPAAYAAPIFITISFTGNGSVGGLGFTTETVTITATADTLKVSFPFGSTRPTYAPPTSLTINVPGFGTGAATSLSSVSLSNVQSQSLGSFLLNYQ